MAGAAVFRTASPLGLALFAGREQDRAEHGPAQIDKSYTGTPLSIGGRKFEHGLGTHALSRLAIDCKVGTERFTAQVGLDDNAAGSRATCSGSVVFAVFGDGRLLWKSGVMRWASPRRPWTST